MSVGPQPEDAGAVVEYGIDEPQGTPNPETNPVMSLALPYAHMLPISTFLTLPFKPDYTTATAI